MRRASSSPEIISMVQPVVERTHSTNARELRASRSAAVATTLTESVTHSWTARLKPRSTRTVSDIASGESNPPLNTPSPNRVTSRPSWICFSRPPCSREIFNRTEFDPISMAAKVGIEGDLLLTVFSQITGTAQPEQTVIIWATNNHEVKTCLDISFAHPSALCGNDFRHHPSPAFNRFVTRLC